MSASMARFAASFTCAGAGKFGKPCARLMPPWTALSRVISRMTDSVKPTVRDARRSRATSIITRPGGDPVGAGVPHLVAAPGLRGQGEGSVLHRTGGQKSELQ